MTPSDNQREDVLDAIGQAILRVDTRWLVIVAVLFVAAFILLRYCIKKRSLSNDDAMQLGMTVLQLYAAPVLFSMLVLTQPPAVQLVGNLERQSAGLLAVIFLVLGVISQILKLWNSPNPAPTGTDTSQTTQGRRDDPHNEHK